jgi:hypothetical protein
MKKIKITKKLFILIIMSIFISTFVTCLPIPTSIFGEISNKENVQVKIISKVNDLVVYENEITTIDEKYVIVFTTDNIEKVNISLIIYEENQIINMKNFTNLETGSKLNYDVWFEPKLPEEEPETEIIIENPTPGESKTSPGGGASSSYDGNFKTVPTVDDIKDEIEKNKELKIEQPSTINNSLDNEDDKKIINNDNQETNSFEKKIETIKEISKSTNSLLILGIILLVLLTTIIILDRKKESKHEE